MQGTDLTINWMRCVKADHSLILHKVCYERYIYFCMEKQSMSSNTSSFVRIHLFYEKTLFSVLKLPAIM